ncbi:DUF1565 domain-containing protein [Actinomyces sp. 2119]|uniref:DUF1565 domain-containing protein n=1 Tax=Actinomyces lilanjuaniae TaxID=2321394 RepID=A0ABN5PSD7_9ACTO|nr:MULTISPECIES: NosD domain-containing protein [Actinomyces]AYD89601.1 DUF1565 domain-containing protein [Actinomyces lilanjuaniae]RJF43029.1 DUF1565 domain-containing protein [Actinomyces sp. 2119]
MRRLAASTVVLLLVLALPSLTATCLLASPAAAEPGGTTIHVSARSGSDDTGDGTSDSPLRTLSAALQAASHGDVIELADGTYREGELVVSTSVTVRAAAGASPVLSGAVVPSSWTQADGRWTTSADMVRFCQVCTENADPAEEGMAAYPEQVFVDGQPLTQVTSRAEVTASTFYVEDPEPVTLRQSGNNRAGYNASPHTGASYVIGVDPQEHHVEVVQHSRAISVSADDVTLRGLTVEKYSPVQRWDYADPQIGTATGGAMVVTTSDRAVVEDSVFRYSAAGTALAVSGGSGSTVTGSRFERNGGVGLGVNSSSNVTVEGNVFTSNNTAGFITTGCGAYCTIGDTKVTHSTAVRFAFNTVDYSGAEADASDPTVFRTDRRVGVWFDEGVIGSQVLGNYFVNVPVAVFNEVSSGNLVASNLIEGAGIGVHISGSDSTKVWNNTVSHALTSIVVQEDSRSDGCNARSEDGTCTAVQNWSASHSLSWDTTGTEIVNNILSSEQTTPLPGDPWRYAAMLQVTGGANDDGSGAVYANEMVSTVNYNAYYRDQDTDLPSTTLLWNWGEDLSSQTVNAPTLAEFTHSPHVTLPAREQNGLDLHGSRQDNPLLVSESPDPTAWKTSDFRPAGPALGSGHPLPDDVAQALGTQAGTAVDRGVLVNVAWQDGAGQGA